MLRRAKRKKKTTKPPVVNTRLLASIKKAAIEKEGFDTKIKITKEFKDAYDAMENTDDHIFLTGRAGTGKSTLLKYFRSKTKKKFVILAPTGVAALNVKGQTIHSFFGFHPKIEKTRVRRAHPDNRKLFENLEVVVIDEISMVRADLLDCVDKALRLNRGRPKEEFGGVQMIFIGDLFQLPPVVTNDEQSRFTSEYISPYFFSSEVMQEIGIKKIELQKVHRQEDRDFIKLLNNIRCGKIDSTDLEAWEACHDPFFDPREEAEYIVHLTTTNKMAEARNNFELQKLDSEEWLLKAKSIGQLGTRKMPSEPKLVVKEGARVMFTTNDPSRRWVNGSLGVIRKIRCKGLEKLPTLYVELDSGERVEVAQHKWEVFEYQYNGENFEEETIGSYSQYPIVLAWAVTIHKAQGKTFDQVLVDVGWGAFAHGQMYVALSRCTTMGGITLLKPFAAKDVIVDRAVLDFMAKDTYKSKPRQSKIEY
ncbi:AAA family ATPase [Patescibacteria group bacterium]|nr:AAA family ATPase [Patescibacteria group bacterium]